jgi:2-dehydro-3-deoxyphosphogluconate aldolase / (4S)-4-hydroxy-2-oxoglutarate aldolase
MEKNKNIETIINEKIIAIIRVDNNKYVESIINALKDAGINIIEISLGTPNALSLIEEMASKYEDEIIIGAGTIIDEKTALDAISIGAKLIVSPIYKSSIITACNRYNIVTIPGVLTPNEAIKAHEDGADFLKIFPASNLGYKYIKAIKAPLPQLRIIPVGGVDLDNIKNFLTNGCDAVALGSSLINSKSLIEEDYKSIAKNAKKFVDIVKELK